MLVFALLLTIGLQAIFVARFLRRNKSNRNESIYSKIMAESEILSSGSQIDLAMNLFTCKTQTGSALIEVATVSTRGAAHVHQNVPNQDSFAAFQTKDFLFFALSDGVSNSPKSHVGSKILTTNLKAAIETHIAYSRIDSQHEWASVNEDLTKEMLVEFLRRNSSNYSTVELDSRNIRIDAARYFAATLEVLAISRAPFGDSDYGKFVFVRLGGDGSVLHLDEHLKSFALVSAEQGKRKEKITNQVSALPICDLEPEIYSGQLSKGQRLIFMTDGLGDQSWTSEFQNSLRTCLTKDQKIESLITFVLGDVVETEDDRTISIFRLV